MFFGGEGGVVLRSSVTGDVVSDVMNQENRVGGLIGYNKGKVDDGFADVSVQGAYGYVGGLVGDNAGHISMSYFVGSVEADRYVGGLVGINIRNIDNSYAIGNVSGDKFVGVLPM